MNLKMFLMISICWWVMKSNAQQYEETANFDVPAARQAVAVDDAYFYAINNTLIVKYSRQGDSITSRSYASSASLPGLKHLNSGIIINGKLYCAHSNYPELPMVSSIEIFDAAILEHTGSVSFGIDVGSCTWVLPDKNGWYVFFAHYDKMQPGRDVSWSQLVKYDVGWKKEQAWVLPKELLPEIRPHSLSGAVLIDGLFYCTGHDAKECYLLKIPDKGSYLEWKGTVPVPFEGQGIAVDESGNLWGISRQKRKVISAKWSE